MAQTRRKQRSHLHKPKRNRFYFKVTGTGPFPTDMLRRDGCFPVSAEDTRRAIYMTDEEKRSGIVMALWGFYPPNVERWASFGWKVTGILVVKRGEEPHEGV